MLGLFLSISITQAQRSREGEIFRAAQEAGRLADIRTGDIGSIPTPEEVQQAADQEGVSAERVQILRSTSVKFDKPREDLGIGKSLEERTFVSPTGETRSGFRSAAEVQEFITRTTTRPIPPEQLTRGQLIGERVPSLLERVGFAISQKEGGVRGIRQVGVRGPEEVIFKEGVLLTAVGRTGTGLQLAPAFMGEIEKARAERRRIEELRIAAEPTIFEKAKETPLLELLGIAKEKVIKALPKKIDTGTPQEIRETLFKFFFEPKRKEKALIGEFIEGARGVVVSGVELGKEGLAFVASKEGREQIAEFGRVIDKELERDPIGALKGAAAVTGVVAVKVAKATKEEIKERPIRFLGETFVLTGIFKAGETLLLKGLKAFRQLKFESKLKTLEKAEVRIPIREVEARLRTGFRVSKKEAQFTFDVEPKVTSVEELARLRAFEKTIGKGVKRPEPKQQILIQPTEKGAIVTLVEKDVIKRFTRNIEEAQEVARKKFILESIRIRDQRIQAKLIPDVKRVIDRSFRELPPSEKPFKIRRKPPEPFLGEPTTRGIIETQAVINRRILRQFEELEKQAPRLIVREVPKTPQELARERGLLFIVPEERLPKIPKPRNVFEELREFERVKFKAFKERFVVPEPTLIPSLGLEKGLVSLLGDVNISLIGDIGAVKTVQRQELISLTDTRTSQLLEQELAQLGKASTRPFGESILDQDIVQITEPTLEQKLRLVTPLRFRFRQPSPPEIPIERPVERAGLPFFFAEPFIPRKEGGFRGFNAFAKERGKLKRLNKKPLTKRAAEDLAAEVVDKTLSATGKVKEIKKPLKSLPKDLQTGFSTFNRFKFRSFRTNRKGEKTTDLPKGVFIERRKFRLDTPSEVKEITIAKFLKQRRKRLAEGVGLNLDLFGNDERGRLKIKL